MVHNRPRIQKYAKFYQSTIEIDKFSEGRPQGIGTVAAHELTGGRRARYAFNILIADRRALK